MKNSIVRFMVALAAACASGMTAAKLPDPSPEQQQAAAAKKQQAAEQAEKEKKELAASMDRISNHWRKRAAEKGWKTHSPTPVQATSGISASGAQSSASGQPGGKQGAAAAKQPIRSEKAGTAPPSEDVKNPAEKGK
ncbi:hypothetical protein GCM10027343_03170 [Noviherbaspirillum agri]